MSTASSAAHARSADELGLVINWNAGFAAEGPVVPVTLLAGFLGAGKTTLLKRLLENRSGMRIGVLVNDVAAVNVDAQSVSSHVAGIDGVEVAQLQNGCVCCSIADDLFSSISTLMARSPFEGFDHLLVELSGVGEPSAVKKNWATALEVRHPAALRSAVRRVVTMVDASVFGADWLNAQSASGRNELDGVVSEEGSQSVVQLLFEQVETADVVLLNKVDLADQEELEAAQALISTLNPEASMLVSEFGCVDVAALLPPAAGVPQGEEVSRTSCSHELGNRNRASHGHEFPTICGDGCYGHGYGHGHGHGHGHVQTCEEHTGQKYTSPMHRYGISSFVYRARRPFDSIRFEAFSQKLCAARSAAIQGRVNTEALTGLLRAKGTCWLTSAPFHEHAWQFAGANAELKKCGPWWAACSAQHLQWRLAYPGMQAAYESVRKEVWDAQGEWGDRRQELIFIGGPEMSEEDLTAMLDACLLSEAEMEAFVGDHVGVDAPFEMSIGGVTMSLG